MHIVYENVQARIKEENKTASFGEISKIVASEWEALAIDEKAGYKRIAENAKNDQFKNIAMGNQFYNNYINTPDAWNSSTAPNYNSYCNQSHQLNPTSPINVSVLQGSEGTGSWSTSFNRYMEERMDDAIGVLQNRVYYLQIPVKAVPLALHL
uniref:HMG box domain-containing protein n=1 Tax=Tetranychus urticae TaxID=32264 RepID=T1L187_TETUR